MSRLHRQHCEVWQSTPTLYTDLIHMPPVCTKCCLKTLNSLYEGLNVKLSYTDDNTRWQWPHTPSLHELSLYKEKQNECLLINVAALKEKFQLTDWISHRRSPSSLPGLANPPWRICGSGVRRVRLPGCVGDGCLIVFFYYYFLLLCIILFSFIFDM